MLVTSAEAALGLARLITWTGGRRRLDLNGAWRSIIDVYDIGIGGPFGNNDIVDGQSARSGFPGDRGRHTPGRRVEYDFDDSPTLQVPGDWNTQVERFHYYEGSMWFRRKVGPTAAHDDGRSRTFLYIGAANHTTLVFLDGIRLAEHVGGFGPFCVEVTGRLHSDRESSLVIRVDNRRTSDAIPTTRTDWFNYGGITRDVMLVEVPATFIRDAVVQLDHADRSRIRVEVWLDGTRSEQEVSVTIGDRLLGSLHTDHLGHAAATFDAPPDLALWSPSSPSLHEVVIRSETDEVSDRIGFRTIGTDGPTILLNGEPIFLAGISMHDEALGENARRIRTADEARELLQVAKELGCNFVRLAHYQHNEHTVRTCDELGLMAWAELPVYWGIDWDHSDTYANGLDQLDELITRDRNRAAVVLWSVANETPPAENRTSFLRGLVARARELDPTRLVTAALFARPATGGHMDSFSGTMCPDWIIDDPLGADLDVLGVNEYHGWYYGSFESMATIAWSTPYDKPLIVSEFGGDARYGLRGAPDESWTEDLQAEIYRHQFEMLDRIPFLAGTSPWILKDFRAPFRLLPGVQDGFNRKGLIDLEGNRKLAFEVVADWNQSRLAREA
jgi:beta-glucuronidase